MSFSAIVKYGKYYNPARLHYSPTTRVICDRCQKENIPVCIGYENQDLCLGCADYVASTMYVNLPEPREPLTLMMSGRFDTALTRMATDRFIGGRDERLTYMMSDRFNFGSRDDDVSSDVSDDVPPHLPTGRVLTKMMTRRFDTNSESPKAKKATTLTSASKPKVVSKPKVETKQSSKK
ncbi:hypothetical protein YASMINEVIRUS_386 [Yasminevirus sp. GU-2018]|uniref:Uncharacterized protein n=1 Tax=Yasminevirus sp. GU-2018 TaxID=2420051 RepID=A0A5K0U990_9VIRU|nr:hypothetical protein YASMINEVIRUS_386 [Yasminevirus sp. GU-2018]